MTISNVQLRAWGKTMKIVAMGLASLVFLGMLLSNPQSAQAGFDMDSEGNVEEKKVDNEE